MENQDSSHAASNTKKKIGRLVQPRYLEASAKNASGRRTPRSTDANRNAEKLRCDSTKRADESSSSVASGIATLAVASDISVAMLSSTPYSQGATRMAISNDVSSISFATEEAVTEPVCGATAFERNSEISSTDAEVVDDDDLLIAYTKYLQAEFLRAKTVASLKERERVFLDAHLSICAANQKLRVDNENLQHEIAERRHRIGLQRELENQKAFLEKVLPPLRKVNEEMAVLASSIENKSNQLPVQGLHISGGSYNEDFEAGLPEINSGSNISNSVMQSGSQKLEDFVKSCSILSSLLKEESSEAQGASKLLRSSASSILKEASNKLLLMDLEASLE